GKPLDGPPDVEVVGAGITGCSAALTLAEAGLRVRVHDARRIAEGASGRNGGFASRGGVMPYDRACEWVGADEAPPHWAAAPPAADGQPWWAMPSGPLAVCGWRSTVPSGTSSAQNMKRCAATALRPSGASLSTRLCSVDSLPDSSTRGMPQLSRRR